MGFLEVQARKEDPGRPTKIPALRLIVRGVVGRQRLELWTRGLKVLCEAIRANTNQQRKPLNRRDL